MAKDFSNFVPEYGDPATAEFRTGSNAVTDQYPFQGETYGVITACEVRETPEGFEQAGLPALDITFSCGEEEAKGKRVTKMFIMTGESTGKDGKTRQNIEQFRQLIASIASANIEIADRAQLEQASRALYAAAKKQGALPNLAKWLVGKTAFYTVKDREVTPKRGRTFATSQCEWMSNRLTYEAKKKDGAHHRANEPFVAALASGASKDSLASTALADGGAPAGVADFSAILGAQN